MGYVGNKPALNYTSFAAQHFTTSATTTYTLDHAVTNENDIRLVINNVVQQPGSGKAYIASGTTLTLSAATSGTDTMYCVFLGKAVQTVVPAQGSVGSDELSADAITGQSALGAEPADTDEFIISDSGVLKRVDYSYIKPTSQVYRDAQPIMINGNYEVWQRGTSFTTSVYTADRWKQDLSGATATVSRQTFTIGQSDVPNNPKYHLRQTVSTANNNCGIFYRHEDVTTLTGNITIAFYAKGTNPNGGNLNIITKQSFGSGGSTAVETSTQNITLTGSWQQFVFNFSLASISGKTVGAGSYLQMLIKQPDGDSSTNAWTLDLANFQVEEGTYTSATLPPFQSETFGNNLARCLRYLQTPIYANDHQGTSEEYATFGLGVYTASGYFRCVRPLPVEMRVNPSLVSNSGSNYFFIGSGANDYVDDLTIHPDSNYKTAFVYNSDEASGTAGQAGNLMGDNTNAYAWLDAEL